MLTTYGVNEIDNDLKLLMSQSQILHQTLPLPWLTATCLLWRSRTTAFLLLLTWLFSLHRPCKINSPYQIHRFLIVSYITAAITKNTNVNIQLTNWLCMKFYIFKRERKCTKGSVRRRVLQYIPNAWSEACPRRFPDRRSFFREIFREEVSEKSWIVPLIGEDTRRKALGFGLLNSWAY